MRFNFLKFMEWFIFMILSILALLCIKDVYHNFQSGDTSFKNYKIPITEAPTVVFCLISKNDPMMKYEFGRDFTIKYDYQDVMDSGAKFDKISTDHSEMCYKINVQIVQFQASIEINFRESIHIENLPLTNFYVTSEQNSYGIVFNEWIDGQELSTQTKFSIVLKLRTKKFKYLPSQNEIICNPNKSFSVSSRLT